MANHVATEAGTGLGERRRTSLPMARRLGRRSVYTHIAMMR
jgi:hypothetical protein